MVRTLLALTLFCLPTAVHAWGELGHRIVCEIAYTELTPTAKAEVDRLMSLDEDFKTFGESCSWADTHARPRRAEEHYVNVPRDFKRFSKTECPLADKCVLTAIEEDSAVLASETATDEEKLEALKFLGHWVGDVHQPLHVSFQDDRGGNDIKVTGVCSGNLHAAWDSCFIHLVMEHFPSGHAVGSDPWFEDFLNYFRNNNPGAQKGEPWQWANSSFATVRRTYTKYCVRTDTGCWYDQGNMRLDDGEAKKTVEIADKRHTDLAMTGSRDDVLLGGIRLGRHLNSIFDPDFVPNYPPVYDIIK